MVYELVICGGTFDRLHSGHKAFLQFAFSKGEQVIIGVTSDMYVAQYKKNKNILPFYQREKEVKDFLEKEGLLKRAKIVAINNRFDQTQIPNTKFVALLVSEETKTIGMEINKERAKQGLSPFDLLVFPLVYNKDNERISSSKIREGYMTRDGIMLPDKSFLSKSLYLPENVRRFLHKPFGMLFTGEIPKQFLRDPKKIVTVGDVITKRLTTMGIMPKVAAIDFFVERHKVGESLSYFGFSGKEKIAHVINPAGSLAPSVWKKLQGIVKNLTNPKTHIVIVEGEEDLLVIPLILMLPLGFFLMYGQPDMTNENTKNGVVILEITEALKLQALNVLKQFEHK